MTPTTITRHTYGLGALGAVLAAAAAGFGGWQLWPHHNRPPTPPAANVPAWFQPIWHYYGNNPQITPHFDFSSPYAGRLPSRSEERNRHLG